MMVPYRKGGMGGLRGLRALGVDPSINPTTIWTPQTGFLGETGTLAAGYQFQPQVYSAYDVPGLLLSAPECTQAQGGAFVSAGCVDQALDVQQENFRRIAEYNANYLTNTRNAPHEPPPPPVTVNAVPAPAAAPVAQVIRTTAAPRSASVSLPISSAEVQNYVDSAAEFLQDDVAVGGFEFPIWGLAAAGIAALLLMKGGR